jgi:hypothetical protein
MFYLSFHCFQSFHSHCFLPAAECDLINNMESPKTMQRYQIPIAQKNDASFIARKEFRHFSTANSREPEKIVN